MSRSADKLEKLKREVKGKIEILQGDVTDSAVVARSLEGITPDLLVLSAGQPPVHGSVAEHTWESFSTNWNNDVKSTFLFGQEVIRRPMPAGTTVVILSIGAALAPGGGPLSGGYGGARRNTHPLARRRSRRTSHCHHRQQRPGGDGLRVSIRASSVLSWRA